MTPEQWTQQHPVGSREAREEPDARIQARREGRMSSELERQEVHPQHAICPEKGCRSVAELHSVTGSGKAIYRCGQGHVHQKTPWPT